MQRQRWFVVQKYYDNCNQGGVLKTYEQLTEEEKMIFEKRECKRISNYELLVDEFPSYERARAFKLGM